MRRISLAHAIRWAYDLKPYELVGKSGEQWSEGGGMPTLYYIEGHFDRSTSRNSVRIMLQNLLKERVGLVSHLEEKEIVVHQIKQSGKGLSKTVVRAQEPPSEALEPPVLQLSSPGGREHLQIEAHNATMNQIASELSRMTTVPVIDSTGLGDARYDIKGWTVDFSEAKSIGAFQDTFFGSLGQLGLAVSTSKALVQVRVVDHISDKLTEN